MDGPVVMTHGITLESLWMFRRFPEYYDAVKKALTDAPGGRLSSEELRKAAGFKVGVLLPVVMAMEEDGELTSVWDRASTPPDRVYTLVEKDRAQ